MSSPVIPRQLVLDLDHSVSFAREDFLSGPSNVAALSLIERWPDWPGRIVALTGQSGQRSINESAATFDGPLRKSSRAKLTE